MVDMFGIVPPVGRGLDVESVWFELLEELFGPVGEGGGGIGGAYEGEGALMFGICEYGECIFEGIESISHTIINIAIDVWGSNKSMEDLSASHSLFNI